MTLLLLYLLYPCTPMPLSYDSPSTLLTLLCCCCCFHRSCIICRTLLPRRVDCDWCPPVPPLYPLCSCRRSSPYCYCCCCRCCVGTTSLYLYRLSCPILAARVLLLCYVVAAEVLPFSAIPPPGTTTYPVLRYFLFVPPNSRLFPHSYIFFFLLHPSLNVFLSSF